jgi:hypothetical protein
VQQRYRDVEAAQPIHRRIAGLIDAIIYFLIFWLILTQWQIAESLGFTSLLLVSFSLFLILRVIPDVIFSQSLGGLILGIKVLTRDNRRLTFDISLIRSLFIPISLFRRKETFEEEGEIYEELSLHESISNSYVANYRKTIKANNATDYLMCFIYYTGLLFGISFIGVSLRLEVSPVQLGFKNYVNAIVQGEEFKDPFDIKPYVIDLRGEVLRFSGETDQRSRLAAYEELAYKDRIETGREGTVLIGFVGDNEWTVRVAPDSVFEISSLSAPRPDQRRFTNFNMLNLIRGLILVESHKRRPSAEFEVRTTAASLAVRGTRFLVYSNEINLWTVFNGEVSVTSYDPSVTTIVENGMSLIQALLPGVQKTRTPESIEVFDIDLKDANSSFDQSTLLQILYYSQLISLEELKEIDSAVGDSVRPLNLPVIRDTHQDEERHLQAQHEERKRVEEQLRLQREQEEIERKIQLEQERELEKLNRARNSFLENFEKFKKDTKRLEDRISSRKSLISSLEYHHETLRRKIESDIECLEESNAECRLNFSQELYRQGFVRLHGSPSYRKELIEGLRRIESEERVRLDEEIQRNDREQMILERRRHLVELTEQNLDRELSVEEAEFLMKRFFERGMAFD